MKRNLKNSVRTSIKTREASRCGLQLKILVCFSRKKSCLSRLEMMKSVLSLPRSHLVSLAHRRNFKETIKSKVSKKVTEYHWKVEQKWKLSCFAGNQTDKDPVVLDSGIGSTVIVTSGDKKSPIPEHTYHDPVDVNLTWLLQQISSDKKRSCCFKIDRSKDTCRTPYRNEDVKEAIDFYDRFQSWSKQTSEHLYRRLERIILSKHDPAGGGDPTTTSASLCSIDTSKIFCPMLPLMEEPRESAGTATREEQPKSVVAVKPSVPDQSISPLLSLGDIDKFLNAQIRSLDEARNASSMLFPSNDTEKLITSHEANLYTLLIYASSLCHQYGSSVGYIEEMLCKQLIAAIGKEVQPKDFDDFMQFHTAKLFYDAYKPKPFCYSIRRPDHYPDGVISIEKKSHGSDGKIEPIHTVVHSIPGETAPPMFFPINAATSVQFTGARYLHGWIQHRFADSSPAMEWETTLAARARQFSSFLLMVGTIEGPDKFNPKDAIIVQNKDEVLIPLLLNELPTAKEFKDAIASLSPEQQRFARSFRGMQLESSVFGVCVMQLKPQLETLLRLPEDALTKEIQLTQDLLSLFIDYQIPSDLLSYDGPDESSSASKVATVKEYVNAVQDVIEKAKNEHLEEAKRKADMNEQRYRERVTAQAQEDVSVDFSVDEAACSVLSKASHVSLGGLGSSQRGFNLYSAAPKKAAPPPRALSHRRASIPAPPGSATRPVIPSIGRGPPPAPAHREMALAVSSVMAVNKLPPPSMAFGTAQTPTTDSAPGQQQPVVHGDDFFVLETGQVGTNQGIDFTMIPKELDTLFEKHDSDSAIRSTIVKSGSRWDRTRQENLLTTAVKASLNPDQVKSEKNKAFDLLDALSRSGSLPFACAELHVIVAITHTFEQDITGTVIQDNINPIEKVEKTYLMMASKIHGAGATRMIRGPAQVARLAASFPALFEAASVEDEEEEQAMTTT